MVSMMPINQKQIKDYFTTNQENILSKIKHVYPDYNIDLLNKKIIYCEHKDLRYLDSDGFEDITRKILGQYESDIDCIKINIEDIAPHVTDLMWSVGSKFCYLFCDIILIHEYMHIFQKEIELKSISRRNKLLEEDANGKILNVFQKAYTEPLEGRKKIFDYFLEQSEYKLPNGYENAWA